MRHDVDGEHDALWSETFARLLALRRVPEGTFNDAMWSLQHYPALLVFYTVGVASVASGREDLLIALGSDAEWRSPFNNSPAQPAAYAVRPDRVLDWDSVNSLSRWEGSKWQQPPSHLVRHEFATLASELIPQRPLSDVLDDVEFRHALLVHVTGNVPHGEMTGEYRGDKHWGGERLAETATRFLSRGSRAGTSWPWWGLLGDDPEQRLADFVAAVAW